MPSDEAAVREQVDRLENAIRAKDAPSLGALYSPEVLAFDLVAPLQRRGADAVRRRAEEWFAGFAGPIGYEMRDLRISVGGDVAFTSSLNGIDGKRRDGQEVHMWIRVTAGWRGGGTAAASRDTLGPGA